MADSDKKSDEQKAAEEFAAAHPGPRSFAVPGNDLTGYIGVAPEYMTYADPTHKPYLTEAEAYLYTDLSNEEILGNRDREFENKNERSAVAEDTGYDFKADQERREAEEKKSDEEKMQDEGVDPKVASGEKTVEVGPTVPAAGTETVRPAFGTPSGQ